MSNWYYYNEKGEKIAVTGGQLKGLAKAGLITPGTLVETENGVKAPAKKVKGLTFGTPGSTPSATAPPEPAQPVESEIYGLSKSKPSSELSIPNYLYTDENGTKYSLPKQRLQTLIDRGVITQNTPLETDTGHTGLAGQIRGLNFNTAAMPQSVPVPATTENSKRVNLRYGILFAVLAFVVVLTIIAKYDEAAMKKSSQQSAPQVMVQQPPRQPAPPVVVQQQPPQPAPPVVVQQPPNVQVQRKKPVDTMTVESLLTRYDNNPLSCDTAYEGERIIVRGVIEEIGRGNRTGQAYVEFRRVSKFINKVWIVTCFFHQADERSLSSLVTGQTIAIEGTYCGSKKKSLHADASSNKLTLSDCSIVSK